MGCWRNCVVQCCLVKPMYSVLSKSHTVRVLDVGNKSMQPCSSLVVWFGAHKFAPSVAFRCRTAAYVTHARLKYR